MDILCTRCGEPWDITSLTDDMTVKEATKLKAGQGCPCCIDKEICQRKETCDVCSLWGWPNEDKPVCRASSFKPINQDSSYTQHELASILGDDIDGLASIMDDFNLI